MEFVLASRQGARYQHSNVTSYFDDLYLCVIVQMDRLRTSLDMGSSSTNRFYGVTDSLERPIVALLAQGGSQADVRCLDDPGILHRCCL